MFNKNVSIITFFKNYMKEIIKITALFIVFAFLTVSCSTSKKHYKPKRKKRDCDCSGYTYLSFDEQSFYGYKNVIKYS